MSRRTSSSAGSCTSRGARRTRVEVVGEAGDGDELVRKVRAHRPDVAIVDIRMPPAQLDEGLRAARLIRAELPEVGLLLLSQHVEQRYATELLEYGAEAVLAYLRAA
jgi:DNA-binding NarL/FixJ family response regulator